jgi:hypothetical protein
MQALPVLALIAALAAKALLRAHHGLPRHSWERWLTVVAAGLTVVTGVLFFIDVDGLVQY